MAQDHRGPGPNEVRAEVGTLPSGLREQWPQIHPTALPPGAMLASSSPDMGLTPAAFLPTETLFPSSITCHMSHITSPAKPSLHPQLPAPVSPLARAGTAPASMGSSYTSTSPRPVTPQPWPLSTVDLELLKSRGPVLLVLVP